VFNLFIIALSISQIIYIWLNTYVFEEYAELFKFDKLNLFYFKDYKWFIKKNENKEDWKVSYQGWLEQKHNNFFIRLILCPICLSLWLALIGCLLFSKILFIFFVSFMSCFGYFFLKLLVKLTNK
jgi:hypothetical protein